MLNEFHTWFSLGCPPVSSSNPGCQYRTYFSWLPNLLLLICSPFWASSPPSLVQISVVIKFSFLLTAEQSSILGGRLPHRLSVLPVTFTPLTRLSCKPSASLSPTTYKRLVTAFPEVRSSRTLLSEWLSPVTDLNTSRNIRSLLVVMKSRRFMINNIQSSFHSGTCLCLTSLSTISMTSHSSPASQRLSNLVLLKLWLLRRRPLRSPPLRLFASHALTKGSQMFA